MGDEQERYITSMLQLAEQVDDLCLDGYVQGGHRFVSHHKLRLQGHGTGNDDALSLTARKLVRVPIEAGGVHAAQFQRFHHLIGDVTFRGQLVMQQRLSDGRANLQPWVKRTVWVLEHVLHAGAHSGQFGIAEREDILAAEQHLTIGFGIETQHRLSDSGFAAA